jgi:lysozyme
LLRAPVTDSQLGALISFAYNVGLAALAGSTLLRLLNAGDAAGASRQFQRWSRANGKVLSGLVRRRAAEQAMFDGRD